MSNEKISIFDIPIDNIRMEQAFAKVISFLEKDFCHIVFTPNSEIMMAARSDALLKEILSSANLLVADGAGVVLGSKILGTPLPERVAGYDLTCKIFEYASQNPLRIFLFGAKPDVVEVAATKIPMMFPGIEIVGYENGYFKPEDESKILDHISKCNPQLLLVALGAPRQEKWIYANRDKIKANVCIGVGGSLDVFAGVAQRAPLIFQKYGLEWFYRLCKQPSRFVRMLALPKFVLYTFAERLFNKRK